MTSGGLRLDQETSYAIRVAGSLAPEWREIFDGLTIAAEREASGAPTTVLSGPVDDQAALHGLLQRLYALGLPLLSVIQLKEEDDQ